MPPAATDTSEPSLQPGDTLRDGRYAISGRLGEGGQATTFDAVDKREGRRVTVKRFRVRGASSWKEVELAEREAKVLSHVAHPNLPVYVDHFEEAGALYLVTEHIEGETVAHLRAGGPVGQDEVLRFLRDASDALDYLHGRSPPLVHRDIKPSNVIRRPDGSFAIIDFGAVRDRLKVTGSTVVGTFGFMAPEQFQGRAMAASDVYAVGATAVAMLAGREPEDLPHKGLAIDVASALEGAVSPSLIRVLTSMLEPDPDRRAHRIAPLLVDLKAGNQADFRGAERGQAGAHARAAAGSPGAPTRPAGPADRRGAGDASAGGPRGAGETSAGGPRGADSADGASGTYGAGDAGGPRGADGAGGAGERRGGARDAGDGADGGSFWDEPARWGQGARVRTDAGDQAQRAVAEAEQQVKRVVEEVGEQVRRVVAEVSAGHSAGARREARKVAEVAKREAKMAFRDAKRAAREVQRAGEDGARREEAEARRREAERRRLEALERARRRRAAPLGGPILLLVLLSLTIAQLAVLLGLKVLAPVVLYLVSGLFFGSVPGRAMRAAARHVSAAGSRAGAAIGRAKDVVRGRIPTPPPGAPVEPTPVHVIGTGAATGAVNPHAHTEVGTVDPYGHTHVSSVSRKEAPSASPEEARGARFTDSGTKGGSARFEDEDIDVDIEAAAEEEAGEAGRRRGKK